MKKRIIAAILVVVMTVLALASCGSAFNFSTENLNAYVTFDIDGFKEALKNIELEDSDDFEFTTDEDTRKLKVAEHIYEAIAKAVIADASTYEEDKKEIGAVNTDRDVVYFCYYATDKDGNVFFFSEMKESAITASSTKAKHVIQLGSYDDDDEFMKNIAEQLKKGFDFGTDEDKKGYSMLVSTDLDDKKVAAGDTVVISYDLELVKYEKGENGEYVTDEDGNKKIKETLDQKANYERLVISADSDNLLAKQIASYIGKDKHTVSVGSYVQIPTGTDDSATLNKKIEITTDDAKYTYNNVKIEWKEERAGTELTFAYTPYTTAQSTEPDNVHTDSTSAKIDLKDKELTYHVFPVYYISVPETNASTILRYAFGDDITASSLEVFEDETYKNGNNTLLSLIEDLVDIYDEVYEDDSDLAKLLKAYEDAEETVDNAGDDVTDDQEEALEKAEKAYLNAQRNAIVAKIDEALKATSSATDAKAIADAVVAEYEEDVYEELKDEYETAVTEAVEQAVYDLIFVSDKYVKLTGEYPEKLLEEFIDHLYESYEYEFYKGEYTSSSSSSTSTGVSNYTQYNGDLDAYLMVATGAEKNHDGNISAAIEAEAKEALDYLLKLYEVTRRFDDAGVSAQVVKYIQNDIDKHAYDANYTYNENLSADENIKAEEKAEKQALENQAEALENAQYFLITDKVYKDYKKALGSTASRAYEEQYGEINIRAALQFNRLFYYLTSTWLHHEEGMEEPEIEYKNGKINFRNVQYTIVEHDH